MILRCMAQYDQKYSKEYIDTFVVAICFENQPRWRQLQTINRTYVEYIPYSNTSHRATVAHTCSSFSLVGSRCF